MVRSREMSKETSGLVQFYPIDYRWLTNRSLDDRIRIGVTHNGMTEDSHNFSKEEDDKPHTLLDTEINEFWTIGQTPNARTRLPSKSQQNRTISRRITLGHKRVHASYRSDRSPFNLPKPMIRLHGTPASSSAKGMCSLRFAPLYSTAHRRFPYRTRYSLAPIRFVPPRTRSKLHSGIPNATSSIIQLSAKGIATQ